MRRSSSIIPEPQEYFVDLDDSKRDSIFVREYLRNESRDDAAAVIAYRKAGFRDPAYPVSIAAERVLVRPEIQSAITAGRKTFKNLVGSEHTRESIVSILDEVVQSALGEKDHSAAVNGLRAQAQILGFMEQSLTITHKQDVSTLTDEQLEKIAARASKAIEGQAKDITPVGIGKMGMAPD